MNFKFYLSLLAATFLLGCQGGEDQTNIELIQDMMEGPQINAQEGTHDGEMLNRKPPEKSVARNNAPYPFDKSDVKKADSLSNPMNTISKSELKKMMTTGKRKYEIYCGICHGEKGLGDGNIAAKMLKRPPNLTEDTYKAYSDGRLFHVITNGWGLMGGYASQIPNEKDRWAIVSHIRKLQNSSSNKDSETQTSQQKSEDN